MKRTFSFGVIASGVALVAGTYGLARFAYGLHLPVIQADLDLDASVAGAISSGASILYCIGAIAGFFIARHPRLLVVLAGSTAAVGSAGVAAASTAPWFAAAVIVASAGAGLASPALVRIVQRNLRPDAAERVQPVVNAGTGPGLMLAAALALLVGAEWRGAWWIAAGFVAASALWVLLADRERAPTAAASLPPRNWWARHARVIAVAIAMGAASAAVWNFGRALLAEQGMADAATIVAWACLGVGGLGGAWAGGLAPARAWTVSVLVLAAATLAMPFVPALSWVVCAVFGWAYVAATGALIGWTTRIDPDHASSGTAMLFVALVVGQAIGATAVGLTIDVAGPTAAFVGAAVVGGVAAMGGVSSAARPVR